MGTVACIVAAVSQGGGKGAVVSLEGGAGRGGEQRARLRGRDRARLSSVCSGFCTARGGDGWEKA